MIGLPISLGTCCVCGKNDETVRNIVALHRLAPIAGTGWGCAICGLGADGALAVLCDECIEGKENPIPKLRWVVSGWVNDGGRIAIEDAPTESFEHDEVQHTQYDHTLNVLDNVLDATQPYWFSLN